MEDYIRATAHRLLDEVEGADEFDLMKALRGAASDDRNRENDRRSRDGTSIASRCGPTAWPERWNPFFHAGRKRSWCTRALRNSPSISGRSSQQRRREPRDDLLSRLVEAEEQGDKLTSDETIVMLRLLLIAGNETTTNLIGNGVRALLRNPDQLTLLRERPELIPAAVEELLRYDSPVQLDMRIARRDLEIGDTAVRSGTMMTLAIGSANHDPERFQRPHALDIQRADQGNISFGRGIHHCLGSPLARLEGRIALEVLLERFDRIGFGGRAPKYRPSVVLRGLEHFDIRVTTRGRSGQVPDTRGNAR